MDGLWYLGGVFFVLLLEELGVPLPFVTSSLMVALGVQWREGLLPLWSILLTSLAASIAGSTVLYALGRLGARPVLIRFGRLWRLSDDRLRQLEARAGKRAFWAILSARFVPGMTQTASVVAGTLRLPLPMLSAAVFVASLGWTIFWLSGGYLGYGVLTPALGFLPPQAQLPVAVLSLVLLLMALLSAARRLARVCGRR